MNYGYGQIAMTLSIFKLNRFYAQRIEVDFSGKPAVLGYSACSNSLTKNNNAANNLA